MPFCQPFPLPSSAEADDSDDRAGNSSSSLPQDATWSHPLLTDSRRTPEEVAEQARLSASEFDILASAWKKDAADVEIQRTAETLLEQFVRFYEPNTKHWVLGDVWHGKETCVIDVHDISSQDFALILTHSLSDAALVAMTSGPHAHRQLIRCRLYACAARSDISYDGKILRDPSERQSKIDEMRESLKSFRRFDWHSSDSSSTHTFDGRRVLSTPAAASVVETNNEDDEVAADTEAPLRSLPTCPQFQTRFEVCNETTFDGVKHFSSKQPPSAVDGAAGSNSGSDDANDLSESTAAAGVVGWVNLANAYNTCGSYNVPFRGSQEEATATSSDGCANLGYVSQHHGDSFLRNIALKHTHVKYNPGWHIPPGGGVVGNCRFLLSNDSEEHQRCVMICVAFADFRPSKPLQKNLFGQAVGERAEFIDDSTGKPRRSQLANYFRRCRQDIVATVLCAIDAGVQHLVAGASGCGAFLHDPHLEAQLWLSVLTEYQGFFKDVRFSVLGSGGHGGRDNLNFEAFERVFGSADRHQDAVVGATASRWLRLERDILDDKRRDELHERQFFPQFASEKAQFKSPWSPFPVSCYDGATLECALLLNPSKRPGRDLVVMFGGNGECVANEVSRPVKGRAESFAETFGADVLCVEYRGYGGGVSLGQRPIMWKILEDTRAVFAAIFASKRLGQPPDRITVFGRSMGSRVALECTALFPTLKAVILDGALSDPSNILEDLIGDEDKDQVGPFSALKQQIAGDHRRQLRAFRGSVLILHTKDDRVHDFQQAKNLHEWAKSGHEEGDAAAVTLVGFEAGGHNGIFGEHNREAYLSALTDFWQSLAEKKE